MEAALGIILAPLNGDMVTKLGTLRIAEMYAARKWGETP
jgi:hypothetical protein